MAEMRSCRPRTLFAAAGTVLLASALIAPVARAECDAARIVAGCDQRGAAEESHDDDAATADRESHEDASEQDAVARSVDELLWRLNESRNDAGLEPLAIRDDVRDIAGGHSVHMADRGRLEHNEAYFSDGSRRRHGARALGENVASGPSIASVHQALMNSEGHRANILDSRFRVIGLGAVHDGESWWVTQDFLQPR